MVHNINIIYYIHSYTCVFGFVCRNVWAPCSLHHRIIRIIIRARRAACTDSLHVLCDEIFSCAHGGAVWLNRYRYVVRDTVRRIVSRGRCKTAEIAVWKHVPTNNSGSENIISALCVMSVCVVDYGGKIYVDLHVTNVLKEKNMTI